MKRTFIALSAVLTIFTVPTSFAEVPIFPHLPPPSYHAPLVNGFYQLTWVGQWKIPPRPEFTDIPKLGISDKNKSWLNYGISIFPRCTKEIIERCISSIEYKDSNASEWSSATFLKYLPVSTSPFNSENRDRYLEWANDEIDSKKNKFWPLDSSRSSLWEINTSLGTQRYLATVSIQYDALFNQFSQFKLSLTPVREVNIRNESDYRDLDPNNTWCARTGYGDSFFQGNNFHPLITSNSSTGLYDYCLVNGVFNPEIRLRINTQLSSDFSEKKLANWVTSRTTETRAYSKSLGENKPIVASFEGRPASIQAGITQVPHTLEGFNDWWFGSPFKKDFDDGKFDLNWFEQLKKNWGIGPEFSGAEGWYGLGWGAINQWNSTEKYIDPRLTIEHTVWNFSVIPLEEAGDNWVSKCKTIMSSTPTFSGVISTNATVFVQGPPKLDSTGNLDFQVAGTHLKQNGDLNLGTYNLSLDQKVANCIWGSATLGASASISVVSQDGIKQVATTSMGTSEGQLNFSASGFHYSTNRISVNLGQPRLSPFKQVSKQVTISCVKGKVTKKVSAVSPKCPSGYKKKA